MGGGGVVEVEVYLSDSFLGIESAEQPAEGFSASDGMGEGGGDCILFFLEVTAFEDGFEGWEGHRGEAVTARSKRFEVRGGEVLDGCSDHSV